MSEEIFVTMPQIPIEEQRKYAGKDVALVDGKIVAWGHTSKEAFEKAKTLHPDKKAEEIGLLYVPETEVLIL
ncbi:MAG: DUF5678 domain-containing protein [Candidatus Zixiibacteriota bacterium]